MIQVELVSASELYLDQKSFTWDIISYEENEIGL